MDILMEGIRVVIEKIYCGDKKYAGAYTIQAVNCFSSKVRLELSGGEPFEPAFREAERLAVVVDAEFVLKEGLKETILRKSYSGEYYHREE